MDRIGFIGLGAMGKPMAQNILRAGYTVTVHNRSRAAVDELIRAGARGASTPAEVAAGADVIITMLPDTPDVESVVLGHRGVVEGVRPDCVVVDMSTIAPAGAVSIAEKLLEKRVEFLDAPVTGGQIGAQNATLSILVGGPESALARCMPVFKILGGKITHMGPNGAGQSAKLCNQVICGLNILAVCEGLALADAAGLDTAKLVSAISDGAASSWMLSNLAPKMLQRDWARGFKIALQQKDLRLALEAANACLVPLPGSALAHQLFRVAETRGRGDEGTQALITVLEILSRPEFGDGDG